MLHYNLHAEGIVSLKANPISVFTDNNLADFIIKLYILWQNKAVQFIFCNKNTLKNKREWESPTLLINRLLNKFKVYKKKYTGHSKCLLFSKVTKDMPIFMITFYHLILYKSCHINLQILNLTSSIS
jgi:hypothetical protein